MAIPRLFKPLLSKITAFVLISFLLAACSTEENFTDTGLADTGVGVAQESSESLPLPATAPVVNLSVSASSIVKGQSTTLNWSSTNAISCAASGGWGGARNIAGSVVISPVVTSTYNLDCNGDGGSASDSVTITVNAAPVPPPVPVVNLSASASSIEKGQSVTLSWSSSDASSCNASGGWGGARNTVGSARLTPMVTTTYILSCNGDGGVANDSVKVTVNDPPAPAPVVNLSLTDSTIEDGQSVILSWSSTNANSCDASGGWTGSRSLSGSASKSPSVTTSYTLTCQGDGGMTSKTVTLTVTEPAPAPMVNLSSSPATIERGQSATLSWSSTNANSCNASGGWSGSRSLSGSASKSPSVTTSYTLTCQGDGGMTSKTVTLTVTEPALAPMVNLSSSPATIERGQSATLSWTSSNVSDCTASGGWGGSRNLSGSATITPTATASYTLSCNGSGGSVSDSVTVTVNDPSPVADKAIDLSWVAPAEREDGTPISMAEIAGYRVYYGTTAGVYPNMVEIAGSDTMNATISGLVSGTYHIVVTTYDMEGNESVHSPSVSGSI